MVSTITTYCLVPIFFSEIKWIVALGCWLLVLIYIKRICWNIVVLSWFLSHIVKDIWKRILLYWLRYCVNLLGLLIRLWCHEIRRLHRWCCLLLLLYLVRLCNHHRLHHLHHLLHLLHHHLLLLLLCRCLRLSIACLLHLLHLPLHLLHLCHLRIRLGCLILNRLLLGLLLCGLSLTLQCIVEWIIEVIQCRAHIVLHWLELSSGHLYLLWHRLILWLRVQRV